MAGGRTGRAAAVTQIYPIDALRAVDRAIMHRENNGLALAERHDLRPRLHPRALLGQDELAPGVVPAGLRQQDRHLQGKGEIAVKVLVQAVVVARVILQE